MNLLEDIANIKSENDFDKTIGKVVKNKNYVNNEVLTCLFINDFIKRGNHCLDLIDFFAINGLSDKINKSIFHVIKLHFFNIDDLKRAQTLEYKLTKEINCFTEDWINFQIDNLERLFKINHPVKYWYYKIFGISKEKYLNF